eukprot:6491799-Pyramimonas_sp.AAC.1
MGGTPKGEKTDDGQGKEVGELLGHEEASRDTTLAHIGAPDRGWQGRCRTHPDARLIREAGEGEGACGEGGVALRPGGIVGDVAASAGGRVEQRGKQTQGCIHQGRLQRDGSAVLHVCIS